MWLGLFKEMTKYEVRVCLMLAVSGLLNTFPSMMPLVTNYEPPYSCDYSKVFNESDTASEMLVSFFLFLFGVGCCTPNSVQNF